MSSVIAICYLPECQLLRALARVLDLPAVATTTAFTYLHRIRCSEHPCLLNSQELVTACIYVAAKAEEVNVSANHLVNSARLLSQPSEQQLLQALAPLDVLKATPAGANHEHAAAAGTAQQPDVVAAVAGSTAQQHAEEPQAAAQGTTGVKQQQQELQESQQPPQPAADETAVVTGDEYYAAKDRLFIAEQVVLRLMSFQLRVQQPLKQLLNFCRLLAVSGAVAAAAVCLLNDAVAYTQLLLGQDAAVVAAAALQLAWQLVQQQQQGVAAFCEVHSRAASADATVAGRGISEGRSTQQRHDDSQHKRSSSRDVRRDASHSQRHSSAYDDDRSLRGHDGAEHSGETRRSSHSRSFSGSAASAGDAALSDGSWLAVVSLQQSEVAEVQQVLQQLLDLQQQ